MSRVFLVLYVVTLICAAGETGDDGYEFGGVDGFGKVKLEAGAKDAHSIFGPCIRGECGRGDLSATFRR